MDAAVKVLRKKRVFEDSMLTNTVLTVSLPESGVVDILVIHQGAAATS